MAIRPEIKNLLARGLTGWDAGRLIIKAGFEKSFERPLLTMPEIKSIGKAMSKASEEDRGLYNLLIEAFQILSNINQLATSYALLACYNLMDVSRLIMGYAFINGASMKHKDEEQSKSKVQEALDAHIDKIWLEQNVEQLIEKKIGTETKINIRYFLSYKAVIERASKVLGVKITESVENCYGQILKDIETYNGYVDLFNLIADSVGKEYRISVKVNIKQLSYDTRVLKQLKNDLAGGIDYGLGPNWWKGTYPGQHLDIEGLIKVLRLGEASTDA